jgi:hypothetical protein
MIVRLLILAALSVGVGCQSVVTPKQAFFSKNPELKNRYVQLDEITIAVLEELTNQKYHSVETLLSGFRQRATNECPSLVAGIDGSLRLSKTFHQGDLERIAELKNAFDERTDHLFYYVCKDGKEYERGWLLLRQGSVVKKLPLGMTFHP